VHEAFADVESYHVFVNSFDWDELDYSSDHGEDVFVVGSDE